MSAPALAGRPSLRIRGTQYPVLLPTARDPRLHLAAVIITLQVLGQTAFDFQLSIAQILVSLVTCRSSRVRDRLPNAARAHVAGERASHGKRCRLRPARARHRARRLVEHERLVDLRRHVCGGAAVEVPDPGPPSSHLQSLELRPRALLPAPRRGTRRPTRAVVGPPFSRARPGARADRRRRFSDPPAAASRRSRGRLLARFCRRYRRPRGERAHDDRRLARRDRSKAPSSGGCSSPRPRSSSSSSS